MNTLEDVGLTEADAALSPWNIVDYLGTEADIAAYLKVAMNEEGIAGFLDAAADVIKARAILGLAKETGIAYGELCRTLSHDVEPSDDTIQRINEALVAPVHA